MTDDLIKRVAAKLGWTRIHERNLGYGVASSWWGTNPEDGVCRLFPPWGTSVDAALSVLEKGVTLCIDWLPEFKLWAVYYGGGESIKDESLPRAILLAFLESPKEVKK